MADSPSRSRAGYVTHRSRIAYENPWLRFLADEITHPNGTPGEHGVVEIPPASAVVALDGRDVLLTRQPRYAIDAMMIEVVKGGAHPGETPQATAQRELREELGLVAARWTPLGTAYEIPSVVRGPISLFVAREVTHVGGSGEAVESIETLRMPFEEAVELALRGGLDDAISVTALLRASRAIA